jgi:hypothetical protein
MYIARPLLWRKHYPDGAQHLVSLLQLSLPGIDPNDPIKTDSTFKFYCSILANVPLVDCSNVPADAEVCDPRVGCVSRVGVSKCDDSLWVGWGVQVLRAA